MQTDSSYFAAEALRLSNAALLLVFLLHLLLRVRTWRTNPFFVPWFLFWVTFLMLYLFVYAPRPLSQWFALSLAVQVLNSFFLLAASVYLRPTPLGRRAAHWRISLINWGIPCLIVLLALSVAGVAAQVLLVNFLSFLALAVYAGRYRKVVLGASDWATVLLFVYAGTNLVFLASSQSDQSLLLAILAVSVPLKIVLYYTGYSVLPRVAPPPSRQDRPTDHIPKPAQAGSATAKVLPPEPTVSVQFSGFWGFLYILWRYPSGKAVVLFILASLLAALVFVASNFNGFVKSLADALS